MKKKMFPLLLLLFSFLSYANDGAFFAKGNQLIPIHETDISVKKEILTVKKVRNQFIEVTVYYEFFNPKEAKTITVGFEAFSPEGDADGRPKNGKHPYMRDFTVEVNNAILNYDVAYVTDSLYAKSGKIKSLNLATIKENQNINDVNFYYVYHFETHFKKGLNIIKHTYNFDISRSVEYHYNFEYVLTAANRWANKQIDDFTLIIDMGELETFSIPKSFFKTADDWLINGIGKVDDTKESQDALFEKGVLKFHLQKGTLIFQKKNFKSEGELFLFAQNYYGFQNLSYLPFSYFQDDKINIPENDFHRKVLKNLPFARRGYVFQNQELNQYFQKMDWYIANPNYISEIKTLTENEQKWIERWK